MKAAATTMRIPFLVSNIFLNPQSCKPLEKTTLSCRKLADQIAAELEIVGNKTAGAKAQINIAALSARLKSCPDTKRLFETHSTSFCAACKAQHIFAALSARLKPCHDTKRRFETHSTSFCAACKVVP
jgi:hypothetical protein